MPWQGEDQLASQLIRDYGMAKGREAAGKVEGARDFSGRTAAAYARNARGTLPLQPALLRRVPLPPSVAYPPYAQLNVTKSK